MWTGNAGWTTCSSILLSTVRQAGAKRGAEGRDRSEREKEFFLNSRARNEEKNLSGTGQLSAQPPDLRSSNPTYPLN